jgi:RNA polymerase sigma-70 factor
MGIITRPVNVYNQAVTRSSSLVALFSAHAAAPLREAPLVELEAELRGAWERGRRRWPAVELDAADFIVYVAKRAPPSATRHADLDALAMEDLYLACACVARRDGALAAFEEALMSQVPGFLAHLRLDAALVEEVGQRVREHLFVAASGQPPRLAEYGGKGSLAAFLRVVAVRQALNARRGKGQARHESDEALARLASPDESPEVAYLRERYAPEFKRALRSALAELTPEAHNLLHLYFVGGVNMAQLAQMFRVNRTTIGRWLQEARDDVNKRARRWLREQLRLSETQLESLYQALASQIDLSLAELAPRAE